MSDTDVIPYKGYTVKELLDNGLRHMDKLENPCIHEKAVIATVRAAVAEFRKHIDESQIVKGELNQYLRRAFGGMGGCLEDFMVLVEQAAGKPHAKCENSVH